jgi:hypothetical protein
MKHKSGQIPDLTPGKSSDVIESITLCYLIIPGLSQAAEPVSARRAGESRIIPGCSQRCTSTVSKGLNCWSRRHDIEFDFKHTSQIDQFVGL